MIPHNSPTFLFYDYETFGINPVLDRPAQFACIRTDINFNVIENPKCFYCFPADDYLPDPVSVLITQITPQYTYKNGMNESSFAKKIYDIFMHSNTCIIGYNNIQFDDEITRHLFYRNFFDAYEWSWKNGNTRWDLLSILRACYALRPDGIKWPHNELGLPVFSLSELTKKNNIIHRHVHDAMSDVYATIELAKLVKQKQPKLFRFFFQHRIKKELYKLIDLDTLYPIVHVSQSFGAIRNNISCILPIAWHPYNVNILIAIDLLTDVEELISFLHNAFIDQIIAADLFKLGIKIIHLNRCPILAPIQTIRIKDFYRLNLNHSLYIKNIVLLKRNRTLFKKIQFFFGKNNLINNSVNVDAQLYNSFFNTHDKILIKKVRETKAHLLKDADFIFHDDRLKNMFFRYRARNFFHIINSDEQKLWLDHCQKLFHTTYLNQYKKQLDLLLIKYFHDQNKLILLNCLLKYFFKISKKCSSLVSN